MKHKGDMMEMTKLERLQNKYEDLSNCYDLLEEEIDSLKCSENHIFDLSARHRSIKVRHIIACIDMARSKIEWALGDLEEEIVELEDQITELESEEGY